MTKKDIDLLTRFTNYVGVFVGITRLTEAKSTDEVEILIRVQATLPILLEEFINLKNAEDNFVESKMAKDDG